MSTKKVTAKRDIHEGELLTDKDIQESGNKSPTGALKLDTGKLRFDLLPPGPMMELAKVYTIGANKYGDRNKELGMPYGRIIGAMLRHLFKWMNGEAYDDVDGQHHLAAVAWGALTLMDYETRCLEFDDRSPSFTLSQKAWKEYVEKTQKEDYVNT